MNCPTDRQNATAAPASMKMKAEKAVARLGDMSHLDDETLKRKMINGSAIKKWSHQIDWDLMRRFDERNGDYRIPEDASLAIMKCMLAIVQLRTHDPVVVQRMTGYPLRFISALVWNLLQNERWMCGAAYLELGWLTTAGPDGDEMLDGWLWSMLRPKTRIRQICSAFALIAPASTSTRFSTITASRSGK
jgi:hypothetical protein